MSHLIFLTLAFCLVTLLNLIFFLFFRFWVTGSLMERKFASLVFLERPRNTSKSSSFYGNVSCFRFIISCKVTVFGLVSNLHQSLLSKLLNSIFSICWPLRWEASFDKVGRHCAQCWKITENVSFNNRAERDTVTFCVDKNSSKMQRM